MNSEETRRFFDSIIENIPNMVFVKDAKDLRFVLFNRAGEELLGLPRETFIGKTPSEAGMPENLINLWTNTVRDVFQTGQPAAIEFAYPGPEGVTEWEARDIPEFGSDGSVQSVLCIMRDITERKRLEALSEIQRKDMRALAARLLTAQEDERRRVSRELHDQICQQLASLAIDIAELAAHPSPPAKERRRRLMALEERAVKTSEEARHLAYELHPSVLDDLGIVSALRALYKEFSAKRSPVVKFTNSPLPGSIPREIAACLYRVTQEALQNAAKHATAHHISVALTFREGIVSLSIEDDGVGFDIERVNGRGGLGLIGMEERARMVNGELSIASRTGHGTRIALAVPLSGGNL